MSLKNAFVKMGLVEEEVKSTPKTPTKTTTPETTTKKAATIPTFTPEPEPEVDPEISEMLEKSLQESKLSNFDYLKFISMVEKMKGKVSSEEARFQTAFSAAEELGLTKTNLLKSCDHYIDVLTEDENDFNDNCSDFEKKEVKSRETRLNTSAANIELLTKQLAQAQEEHETLQKEVEEQKEKLEARKQSFQTTLESFRSTIKENVDKINQYLS
jgi:hypothetical protein